MSSKVNYMYLRPKKAEALRIRHEGVFYRKDDLKIEIYDNATILPLQMDYRLNVSWGMGGVVDNHNNYVELSANGNLYRGDYEVEEIEKSDSVVVYCGYFRHHWGDFIVDCTGRLYYYLSKNKLDKIDKYVYFVEYDGDKEVIGNYREFFEILGIWDKLLFINKPTSYRKVIIPELSYDRSKNYYSSKFLEVFRFITKSVLSEYNIDDKENEQKKEKIFFTRSALSKSIKMEFGTQVLDSFFKNNQYNIISPEKISLRQCIVAINSAKTIACISGTLPHNLLFTDNKELIILERNSLNNIIQVDINRMLNLEVIYIDSNESIYPVELSYGPFIYVYNQYLKEYAKANNYVAPDDEFLTEKYKRIQFKKYIDTYRKEHGLCLYMPDWMVNYSKQIFEAYQDGEAYFWDYLKGKKYYKVSQYFSIDFLKRIVKRIIRR